MEVECKACRWTRLRVSGSTILSPLRYALDRNARSAQRLRYGDHRANSTNRHGISSIPDMDAASHESMPNCNTVHSVSMRLFLVRLRLLWRAWAHAAVAWVG